MASVSRILAKNLLPKPSPFEAPSTKPAMSTNSMVVGRTRSGLTISAKGPKRGSGTATIPVLGSMVQNGKFSAAMPDLVKALNRVDLPTLGKPTIPQLNPMMMSSGKKIQAFWLCSCCIAREKLPSRRSGSTPRANSILVCMSSCSLRGARPNT